MTPLALALLCSSSFAGSFLGQRVKLPASWLRFAERAARAAVDAHAASCAARGTYVDAAAVPQLPQQQ